MREWELRMKTVWRTKRMAGALVALALCGVMNPPAAPGAEKKSAKPAEADLFLHLKDAFKNPADEPGVPRVLLIGDSISIGYTIPVRRQLRGKANVFRPPVNCQHTGYGLANLDAWLGTSRWDVIHFNWGIWDTHMLDAKGALIRAESAAKGPMHIRYTPEQYGQNLSKLVDRLQATGARLIWASTTPVMSRSGARFEDIAIRNAVAAKLMKARNIPIEDLYPYTLPHAKEWQKSDKVHFNDEGNQHLADRVCESILRELKASPRGTGKPGVEN
jgi:acyl-CoA thioesterase-1